MNVRKMTLTAMFSALMAICAWISIPIPPIAFTLQTFGVLLALTTLGGKQGSTCILAYLAMGCIGLPVFSGFRGGAAALLEPSGGFLWGFLAGSLAYWGTERLGPPLSSMLCQLTCYLCGCLWFSRWAGCGIGAAFAACVLPYLIPDGIKLWLALQVSGRIRRQLK